MIVFATLDHAAPAGGIRVVYAMVEALERAGVDAAVWHASDGFRATWFDSDARVVSGAERRLEPGDVLVMPEIGGARHHHLTRHARVVVLNQRHSYTVEPGLAASDPSAYPGWPNCVAVVSTSEAITRFVEALVADRIPVERATVLVDDDFFLDQPKQRLVTCVESRRPGDVAALGHLLARSPHLPEGWRFQVVGGLGKTELARVLAETAVYVSTADHDGFSLMGAEALAAGCDVVGFHGDGAREYLRPEFSTVVDDPDLVGLRDAVVAAAREFDEDQETYRRRRAAGRAFVRDHYAADVFAARTVEVFADLVDRGVGQDRAVTVRHMYAGPTRAQRIRAAGRRVVRRG
ncbi:hypothetical protein GCM10011519_27190 [Marmoricola endophyticus]|uniref:Glycosyltransferase n=1 Tax=Marmoricola endophyticus TaxID=2040280 RepID=A0A917BQ22_9ACTN|nr:glycosyltransferase [Marmoricola endophyticus]GGF51736.1 hypothetical protein GCM10011519_27190 [Marmoricola endophyticus]